MGNPGFLYIYWIFPINC